MCIRDRYQSLRYTFVDSCIRFTCFQYEVYLFTTIRSRHNIIRDFDELKQKISLPLRCEGPHHNLPPLKGTDATGLRHGFAFQPPTKPTFPSPHAIMSLLFSIASFFSGNPMAGQRDKCKIVARMLQAGVALAFLPAPFCSYEFPKIRRSVSVEYTAG